MKHTLKNLKIVFVKFIGKIRRTLVAGLSYVIVHHAHSLLGIVYNQLTVFYSIRYIKHKVILAILGFCQEKVSVYI